MVLQFSLFSLYIKISSFKIKAGWLGGKKIKMVKHLITWTFWYTKKKEHSCLSSASKAVTLHVADPQRNHWPSWPWGSETRCGAQHRCTKMQHWADLPFFWTKKDKQGTAKRQSHWPPCILSPRRWRRSPVTCGWFRELGRHGLERNWKYSGWFRINMDPVPFPCPTTINFAIKIQALSLSAGVWGSHLRPWISVHTTGPSLFVGLLDWPETWPGATDQNLEQIWVWQWPHLGDFHDSRFNVSV